MKRIHAQQISIAIGNKIICSNLDIAVHAGKIWGILGPNGSGKTTLLHTLAGLHPITHGEILLHESKLDNLSIKSVAQQRGILFQDFHETFPQTVWEYCLGARFPHLPYFKKEDVQDTQIVMSALQTMELDEYIYRNITQLSGGEKRRLAIATLLAQTPDIYLLDEPTNHLDVRHQMKALKHFQHLAETKSAAVMMSLHDVNIAQQFCDHILLLFANGSAMQGPSHELLTTENLTRLYGHPMRSIANGTSRFWPLFWHCEMQA